jgi:PTH1 family peptidyl-tRNA hydrolase
MESILERLGSDDFARLRIGIGRPPGQMDPADYVLQEIPESDLPAVSECLDRAVEAALVWMVEGLDTAMNRFNGTGL